MESFDSIMDDMYALEQEARNAYEKEAEEKWNSLTEDEQLQMFYSVVKRIHKGELEDMRSFRGVLYDVFGFSPKAYTIAMDAGYMSLHNSLVENEGNTPFICGMPGKKDLNGMSEYVTICPAYGSDVTYLYQRVNIDDIK